MNLLPTSYNLHRHLTMFNISILLKSHLHFVVEKLEDKINVVFQALTKNYNNHLLKYPFVNRTKMNEPKQLLLVHDTGKIFVTIQVQVRVQSPIPKSNSNFTVDFNNQEKNDSKSDTLIQIKN